ncbi:MAG: hypothetical protein WA197_14960 [Candidatus Acidiferrales bacterium]
MEKITNKPLFDLGRLVATAGALAALEKTGQNAVEFLARHVTGDWGELPVEDRAENCLSLQHGFRLLSSYRTAAGSGSLPKPTAPRPSFYFPKNIDVQKTKKKKRRRTS